MKPLLSLPLALALLVHAPDGWAFGRQGHRIVCEVAYQLLAPATRAEVDRLLAAVPEAHRDGIRQYLRGPEESSLDFADSCVWPDVVKRGDEYDATYEWHFINVQREDSEVKLDDCIVGCLLSAIDHHGAILDSALGDWPRAQALMFLGHWVADIHQPLHVSFGDDRGGNGTPVTVAPAPGAAAVGESNCANLHAVWDYCIIEESGFSEARIAAMLLNEIARAPAPEGDDGTPVEWANESLRLSRSPVVAYCRAAGARCEPYPVPEGGTRTLPRSYYSDSWPILSERMKQAAIRLAHLLERLLAEDAESTGAAALRARP